MLKTENPDIYLDEQSKILNELANLENKSFETKKSYIMRLREVTRPLVETGYYDGVKLSDLSSFIFDDLLKKHNVNVVRNDSYYSLFTNEEKHEYNSTKSRKKITSLPLEKQTGNRIIDRLKQFARAEVNQPEDYEYTVYFNKLSEVSNQIIKQSESLLSKLGKSYFFIEKFDEMFKSHDDLNKELEKLHGKKLKELEGLHTYYHNCQNIIKTVEGGIGNTSKKIDELNELLSIQKFTSKQLDERNKITFIEKWNSIVANIEIGISAIAKKLGVNKKHLTNNVRPDSNPVTGSENIHHKQIGWFKHIQVISPSGEEFIFDAKDYFDKQIERGKLNIPFTPLILKNSDVI